MDTILACTGTGAGFVQRLIHMGQETALIGGDNIVYIKDVKVGTTRGGTDLFADDFSSGDFSNWDSTTGDCTVVPDPF